LAASSIGRVGLPPVSSLVDRKSNIGTVPDLGSTRGGNLEEDLGNGRDIGGVREDIRHEVDVLYVLTCAILSAMFFKRSNKNSLMYQLIGDAYITV
jgi:hypothetical protein